MHAQISLERSERILADTVPQSLDRILKNAVSAGPQMISIGGLDGSSFAEDQLDERASDSASHFTLLLTESGSRRFSNLLGADTDIASPREAQLAQTADGLKVTGCSVVGLGGGVAGQSGLPFPDAFYGFGYAATEQLGRYAHHCGRKSFNCGFFRDETYFAREGKPNGRRASERLALCRRRYHHRHRSCLPAETTRAHPPNDVGLN